jgi:hypothetical protein
MILDRENCLADGLTEAEIQVMEEYLRDRAIMDNTLALVKIGEHHRLVCQTVAEALELVRPGSWLRFGRLHQHRQAWGLAVLLTVRRTT